MISYQWDSKPTMLRVRDRLRKAGHKVWMDIDNLSEYLPDDITVSFATFHALYCDESRWFHLGRNGRGGRKSSCSRRLLDIKVQGQ